MPESGNAHEGAAHPANEERCFHIEGGHTCRPLPPVGSMKWRFVTSVANLLLVVVPVLLAVTTVRQLMTPKVYSTSLEVGVMHGVDGAVWERLLLATPAFCVTAFVGLICYVLWRVEMNLWAGRRPFTEGDTVWLRWVRNIEAALLLVAMSSYWLVPPYLPSLDQFSSPQVAPVTSDPLLLIIGGLVMASFVRVYHLGKRAYDRQEDVV